MIFTLETYDKAHKRAMKRGAKALRRSVVKRHGRLYCLLKTQRQLHVGQLIIDRMKREFNV